MSNNDEELDKESSGDSEEGMLEGIIGSHIAMATLVTKLTKEESERSMECIACHCDDGSHLEDCAYQHLLDFLVKVKSLLSDDESI